MNTEYANIAPAALACSRYVRLKIDEGSTIRQADPLPAGLETSCDMPADMFNVSR